MNDKTIEAITCPVCADFTSKRTTQVERHLAEVHHTTLQQEWDRLHGGPGKCACGCGQLTTWYGYKKGYSSALLGHAGSTSYISAIHGEEKAQQIKTKRLDKIRGIVGWSKGLTKETDDRVAQRAQATAIGRKAAFDAGDITAWSKGLTKETDARLLEQSERQRRQFASGELTPWAKGQTKATDPRVAAMAAKVSLTHSQTKLRQQLDDAKRLQIDDIKRRIEANGRLKVIDSSLSDYVNDNTPNILVECTTCGTQNYSTLRRLSHGRCHLCDPGGSLAQHDVAAWLRSKGVQIDINRRDLLSGFELDIFVPAHRVAVEYNGLYWHNITQKSAVYHQNKSDACAQANIKLFHLFEDEWRDRRDVVQSMLLHRLQLTSDKLGARVCSFQPLSVKQRREFFEKNHIDGDTNAHEAHGLISPVGDIVAAMSLRHPFHKKHTQSLEVARACCALNLSVSGWLGKLTTHSKLSAQQQGFTKLITYVDTRFGTTDNWATASWTKTSETPPRFWWTDNENRFNRFKYKANKSAGLTEAQVAAQANVYKIFGCKNIVYELTV